MKCGVWSVECEECSVKCGAWRVQCECEEWSVKCGVWSVKCGVWRKKWEVWSVDCEVWSVKCGVWSVKCGVLRVQCEVKSGVRRVQYEVWRKCEVWSVKSAVRSVECEVDLQMWHAKQDKTFAECTHARAWLAHGACKFYRWERSYSISLRQLPPCLVRVLLVSNYLLFCLTLQGLSGHHSKCSNQCEIRSFLPRAVWNVDSGHGTPNDSNVKYSKLSCQGGNRQ